MSLSLVYADGITPLGTRTHSGLVCARQPDPLALVTACRLSVPRPIEREVELVAQLPIRPFNAERAARNWQLDLDATRKILDELASRAILVDIEQDGETFYVLPPPMAGFFEFSLMRIRQDLDQQLLSELFYQYLNVEEDFIRELFAAGTQLGRMFVHEPVLSNDNALHVLDYERASEGIKTATHIGVGLCYCRHKLAHLDKACAAPLDFCMTFNTSAAALTMHGHARAIEASECLDLLQTTVLWDRRTGLPLANAIVWQDRRTARFCDDMKRASHADRIVRDTGLVIDAYFSGSKLRWLLHHVPGARDRAQRGELAFGTIDAWLVWNLTAGAQHVTDRSNASRTMLYNLHTGTWDSELLNLFDIPPEVLPEIRPSSQRYADTAPGLFGAPIRIAGIAGDQQAALYGQNCFSPGLAKNTYGTGCFMLMNVGLQSVPSRHQLITTVA